MSKNKQTAVDYIDKAIDKYLAYSVEGSHKAKPFTINDLLIAVEQAKEMEKQQIMDDFNNGVNDEWLGKNTKAEKYYNEEYGK